MLPPLWFAVFGPFGVAERLDACEREGLCLRDAFEERYQGLQLDGVLVLTQVILARYRAQHLGGALMRFMNYRLQLAAAVPD